MFKLHDFYCPQCQLILEALIKIPQGKKPETMTPLRALIRRRTMLSDSDQSWAYWAIVGALLLAWAVVVL